MPLVTPAYLIAVRNHPCMPNDPVYPQESEETDCVQGIGLAMQQTAVQVFIVLPVWQWLHHCCGCRPDANAAVTPRCSLKSTPGWPTCDEMRWVTCLHESSAIKHQTEWLSSHLKPNLPVTGQVHWPLCHYHNKIWFTQWYSAIHFR
jgi:hypothetical protein